MAGGVATDPISWQCSNASRFLNVAKCARKVFAIQSSSVSRELNFSIAGNLAGVGKPAMSDETLL